MMPFFRCRVIAGIRGSKTLRPSRRGIEKDLEKKSSIMFEDLYSLSVQCFRTLNVILIHERLTLFHVCVDPGVVLGGLSVRPVLSSLWMERSLSIFSESQSWGSLCAQIKPVA